MTEFDQLQNRVAQLENLLGVLIHSDRYVFEKDIQMGNGRNIIFARGISGTGVGGTKIGTATDQKLAFWGLTPIVQPSSTGELDGFTAGGGGTAVKDVSTFTGDTGLTAYTIGDIVKHLKNLGLILS